MKTNLENCVCFFCFQSIDFHSVAYGGDTFGFLELQVAGLEFLHFRGICRSLKRIVVSCDFNDVWYCPTCSLLNPFVTIFDLDVFIVRFCSNLTVSEPPSPLTPCNWFCIASTGTKSSCRSPDSSSGKVTKPSDVGSSTRFSIDERILKCKFDFRRHSQGGNPNKLPFLQLCHLIWSRSQIIDFTHRILEFVKIALQSVWIHGTPGRCRWQLWLRWLGRSWAASRDQPLWWRLLGDSWRRGGWWAV